MGIGCVPKRSDLYRPRSPEDTLLYEVLSQHLESFLEHVEARGRSLPSFVVRELRAFLTCGVSAHGFSRIRCADCGHELALPFSCKGRGFCPSCCGRFMAETAAHLVDHVLPDVPYRQWVLTLPFELRYRVAYDPDLCSATLAAFIAEVDAWYVAQTQELGLESSQWGGLTVIQRFGSDLRANPHFHSLAVDGVFEIESDSPCATFHRVAAAPLLGTTPHGYHTHCEN